MSEPHFEQSEFEYITRIDVPDGGKLAVSKYIDEWHIEFENQDTVISYIGMPTTSDIKPFLALFSGRYSYDYRLQVFVLLGWFENDEWHIVKVHEWFVAAMSGEVNRTVKIMKQRYPAKTEEY